MGNIASQSNSEWSGESHKDRDGLVEKSPNTFGRTSAFRESKKENRTENDPSQDCIIVDDAHGIYGVFDGMGGMGGRPDIAAERARNAISEVLRTAPKSVSIHDLETTIRMAFIAGRQSVNYTVNRELGSTTALVAWHTYLNDKPFWVIGNAGDSQLFSFDKTTKEYKAITTDQSDKDGWIVNGFSALPDNFDEHNDEFFMLPADSQTRIMLCSDGIRGNDDKDRLTDQEMIACFDKRTPRGAAKSFLSTSRKNDDKSVIVIDVI